MPSTDRRAAKKLACRISWQLIDTYLASGNVEDWPEFDPDVLESAFRDLIDELERRGRPS